MTVLPLLICAVILIFQKSEKASARYLGAFFIVIALGMGPQIIGFAGFYERWPGLTFFPLFFMTLWLGPLLYFHAFRLMRNDPAGWRWALFLPAGVQLIYYLAAFFLIGEGWQDYQAKWAFNNTVHAPYILKVQSLTSMALFIFALFACFRMIKRYRHYLEHTQSQALDFDPKWLRFMLLGLGVALILYVAAELYALWRPQNYRGSFYILVLILFVCVWLGLNAVFRLSKPFPKMPKPVWEQDNDKVVDKEPADQNIEDEQGSLAETLRQRITEEKWYLEPQFSIRDLAARIGTNESYISRALNQGLGQSFNRFINGLRVSYAQNLIQQKDIAMITVAYESGFNSKATFNRVFRDICGQTPSAFKKSQNPSMS